MIQKISNRLFRKSKLYSAILGLTLFFVLSIFTSFAHAMVGVVLGGLVISVIHSLFKKEVVIYDQTWRPSLYFAFVLVPLLAFLITLLF